MNLAVTNTRTIKLVKQHSIAAFGGVCLALAAAATGVVAVSQTGGGSATVAPTADYTWTRTTADDWRTIYYIVPTQEQGDQILAAEAEQQNVILESQGQLPARTIRVLVVDSREQQDLVSSMMAEASAETTSFVDLRYPALSVIEPAGEAPLSQVAPFADGDFLPAPSGVAVIHQPFPCSESEGLLSTVTAEMLTGLCN